MPDGRRLGHLPWRTAMFALALAALGCTAGRPVREPALVPSTMRDWSQDGFIGRCISTAHFEIISTLRDARFEAALPACLEAAYQRYQDMLPSPGHGGPRLTVYVFGTRTEWDRYTRRRFPTRYSVYSRIRSGGFTEGNASVSFHVNRAATLATLVHEGWHQYVGSRFDTPLPAWLNEGLACYHESVHYAGPKPEFTPHHNTFRINSLRDALQRDTLLSLSEIVSTDAGRVISRSDARAVRVYYAQAWALVTLLRVGSEGRYSHGFDRLLADIADGTFRVRVSAAGLGAVDRTTMSQGEAALRAYFGCTSEALADEYYEHLVSVAGF